MLVSIQSRSGGVQFTAIYEGSPRLVHEIAIGSR